MAESRGVDVKRESDTSLLFEALLLDAGGAKITAASVLPFGVRIWHVIPTTGALETYDFNDNTFKVGAVTTPAVVTTHRTVENGTYNTGLHYYRHTTLTNFTIGDKYIVEFSHTSLPSVQQREFQYGGVEGDSLQPTTTGLTLDVSATGEAGLDFANVKQATAPTTLTNITVPDVTTTATATSTGTVTGNVSGNVTGSVGSVLGSVAGNVTGSVGSVTGITSSDVGAIKAKTDLIPAGGPPASSDYTAGRAAKLDFLDMAISAVPGGVPSISGTVSVAPAPTAQGFTTNLNYPANYLRDGTLRFAGGAMLNVAVRIASNTAGPNSALTFVVPTPAVAVAGVVFSVSTEDRHGAPAAPGGF